MRSYKYTPYIHEFIEKSLLKITPVQHLNDPFENNMTESQITNIIGVYERNGFENCAENIAQTFRNNEKYLGVVSFSSVNKSLLMLAYYANEHKGGILEFEVDENIPSKLFENENINLSFKPVDYIQTRHFKIGENNFQDTLSNRAFQKGESWCNEKEYRFVGDFRDADFISLESTSNYFNKLEGRFSIRGMEIGCIPKDNDSSSTQLDTKKLLFWNSLINEKSDYHPFLKVCPSTLTGIYLGCRFSGELLSEEMLKKFTNLNNQVFKLEVNSNEFSLNEKCI